MVNKFFANVIYETDFKLLIYLKNLKFFSNKSILDVGANDGISIKAIRKFIDNKIYSFEPNLINFKKIKSLKQKYKNLNVYNFGLSNKNKKDVFIYEAYFKKYHLSPFDSLQYDDVLKHLKSSLFIKNISKKVKIIKKKINLKKLDYFKLSPCFIKIDVQGHEYECIIGSLKTIKKYKPILMIEYDIKIINKINQILKKFGYMKYFYLVNKKKLIKHKKEKVFNMFFIHKDLISEIKKNIEVTEN